LKTEDGKSVQMITLYYLDGGDVKTAWRATSHARHIFAGNQNAHVRFSEHLQP